jgi:F-type H+-transporting ATPase subunit epsilon
MADLQFDLVSPERSLASYAAQSVEVPGAEGDMTVLADHAPLITTLRPGLLRVTVGGDVHEFLVSGGFAEIGGDSISVLAETAHARADLQQGDLDAMMEAAQKSYEAAKENNSAVDEAAKLVSDLQAVAAQMGMNA